MENKSKEPKLKKIVLGAAALIVVIVGIGLGLIKGRTKEIVKIDQLGGRVTVGRSLKVISCEPACPAVLKAGERLNIRFRYKLGPSDAVQIWVRPYTNGHRTPGYRAHGSSGYKKSIR